MVKQRRVIRLSRLLLLVSNLENYLVISYSLQYPLFDVVVFHKRRRQSDELNGAHGVSEAETGHFKDVV